MRAVALGADGESVTVVEPLFVGNLPGDLFYLLQVAHLRPRQQNEETVDGAGVQMQAIENLPIGAEENTRLTCASDLRAQSGELLYGDGLQSGGAGGKELVTHHLPVI